MEKKIIFAIAVILTILGCSFVPPYDSLSHKQLTDLKGDTKVFFDNCSKYGAHGDASYADLLDLKRKSSKAYKYEKEKGLLNYDTAAQLESIDITMSNIINRYKTNEYSPEKCIQRRDGKENIDTGCLTQNYCKGKWSAFSSKFDIAISTEISKVNDKSR